MGWRWGPERDPTRKRHPDLVPYAALPKSEQEKDWVFYMLCRIAARISEDKRSSVRKKG
jgi:hypothetical protein